MKDTLIKVENTFGNIELKVYRIEEIIPAGGCLLEQHSQPEIEDSLVGIVEMVLSTTVSEDNRQLFYPTTENQYF